MRNVVVRFGYNAPEIAVLVSEGPKTYTVLPLYGISLERALEDAPNRKHGERWGKDSRIILLDPEQDVATLEVVKTMIRKHRSAREQVAQIEKLARNEYLADVKVLFPEVSA